MKKHVVVIILLLCSKLCCADTGAIRATADYVKESIYTLHITRNDNKNIQGSAVALRSDLLATNCHVTDNAKKIVVKAGEEQDRAQQVYTDKKLDLCLLKTDKNNLTPVLLRAEKTVTLDEPVFAIGSPGGKERTITYGKVLNKIYYHSAIWIESSAQISPGSSGGGLFDENGKLIGITSLTIGKNAYAFSVDSVLEAYLSGQSEPYTKPRKFVELPADEKAQYALLEKFGGGEILLIKLGGQCLMVFHSSNHINSNQALLLLVPDSGLMMLFTQGDTLQQALDWVELVYSRRIKAFDMPSSSYAEIAGEQYRLREMTSAAAALPFYIVHMPLKALNEMKQQSYIHFTVIDSSATFPQQQLRFSLYGYDQAMASQSKLCQRQKMGDKNNW